MKNILLLSVLFYCISFPLSASDWIASNSFQSSYFKVTDQALDENNNQYIIAEFKDSIILPNNNILRSHGHNDVVLIKVGSNCEFKWAKQFGSIQKDIPGGVGVFEDNIAIAVNFKDTISFDGNVVANIGGLDVLVITLDTLGNLQQFENVTPVSNTQLASDIEVGSNEILLGGFFIDSLVVGSNNNFHTEKRTSGLFISQFNFDLDFNWNKSYGIGNNYTKITDIKLANNTYYVAGYFNSGVNLGVDSLIATTSGKLDAFLFRLDSDGSEQWALKIGGNANENITALTIDEYENIFLLGYYEDPSLLIPESVSSSKTVGQFHKGGRDVFLLKYNRSGNLLWEKYEGSTGDDFYYDIAIKGDIFYLTGIFQNSITIGQDELLAASGYDGFLGAYTLDGAAVAGIAISGDDGDEFTQSLTIDNNLKTYIAGNYSSSNISIGDSVYSNDVPGTNNFFIASYQHPFKISVTEQENVNCNGGSDGAFTVTPFYGNGPYVYDWSHTDTLADSTAINLAAGIYSVTITDSRDSTVIANVEITEPELINSTANITNASCFLSTNGAIDLNITEGTAPYNYTWTGGSGINPSDEDQSELMAGEYYVLIEDANNCTARDTFAITQPSYISITSVETNASGKEINDGAIHISITGGSENYTGFEWSGPNEYTNTDQNISDLFHGSYYVTVTDNQGCSNDTNMSIHHPGLYAFISEKTDVTCYQLNNGSASASAQNSTGSLSYIWTNEAGDTLQGFNLDGPEKIIYVSGGKYFVEVVDDATNDTAVTEVVIFEPTGTLELNSSVTPPRCYGESNAIINITVSGGAAPYNYQWASGSTSEDLINIVSTGSPDTLSVTDKLGCPATIIVDVPTPEPLAIELIKRNPLCFGSSDGEIEAAMTGGNGKFTYKW
ncbi:SprB repeat-containing protein, partial [Bacteroidales bacterium]|nr:SprB repeat-containing protein [Bacteroidales bacterium]